MSTIREARGRAGRLAGRRAEVLAALLLMAKGYRILGFRLKTRQAEIDLLALRRNVLVVVEVKRRTSLAAALDTVTVDQRERLRRAGAALAASRPALRGAAVRLDLIALARGWVPMHIPDVWKASEAKGIGTSGAGGG